MSFRIKWTGERWYGGILGIVAIMAGGNLRAPIYLSLASSASYYILFIYDRDGANTQM